MITVFGPRDSVPRGALVVNTTSRSADFGRSLSPFLLGPCALYGGRKSTSVENGWQFSKLFDVHADDDGNPTAAYWRWAEAGWSSPRAVRYPMGKGAKPLCSLWNGERLGYIDARLRIYAPLYAAAAARTKAFEQLARLAAGGDVALFDFDAYRIDLDETTLQHVLLNEKRPMGHAFVLKMMLEGSLDRLLHTNTEGA